MAPVTMMAAVEEIEAAGRWVTDCGVGSNIVRLHILAHKLYSDHPLLKVWGESILMMSAN